ncbi:hypothetical protein Lser_V15G26002 [Lactuca serriola]
MKMPAFKQTFVWVSFLLLLSSSIIYKIMLKHWIPNNFNKIAMAEEKKNLQLTFPEVVWDPDPFLKMTLQELVGMKGEDAAKKIEEEMLGATVHVVHEDSAVTVGYRLDQVKLILDSSETVVAINLIIAKL